MAGTGVVAANGGGAGTSNGGTAGIGGRTGDGGVLANGQPCPGRMNPDAASAVLCRDSSDCPPRPDFTASCVVYPACEAALDVAPCESDGDCPPAWLCSSVDICGERTCALSEPCNETNCSGPYECVAGACRAKPCNEPDALPCAEGYECRNPAPENPSVRSSCLPISCADGFQCAPPLACDGVGVKDAHGCSGSSCAADADCSCGYCVNRTCEPTVGVCSYEIVAAPYGTVWPDEEWV